MTSIVDARLRKNLDYSLIIFTLLTVCMGLVVLYSATKDNPNHFYQKQLLFAGIGIVALLGASSIDYGKLPRITTYLYVLNIGFLIFVLKFSAKIKGAARWINLGVTQFQPSEFAKLVMIICLAVYLQRRIEKIKDLQTLIGSLLYILVPTLLIFKQPDLGTSLVIVTIWFGMAYIAGARTLHLFGVLSLGAIMFFGMWRLNVLQPFQKKRLVVFMNPEEDPKEAGYQVIQARIAVGSGQIFGKGILKGTQAHGKFIPENHSDFIFTVLGEEGGFAWSSLLILFYGGILLRGSMIMAHAEDTLGRLLATGIVSMYAFHIIVNIGMTIGIMPITGVPLPLMSYGGSNLLLNLFAIGLLLSIGMRRHRLVF